MPRTLCSVTSYQELDMGLVGCLHSETGFAPVSWLSDTYQHAMPAQQVEQVLSR